MEKEILPHITDWHTSEATSLKPDTPTHEMSRLKPKPDRRASAEIGFTGHSSDRAKRVSPPPAKLPLFKDERRREISLHLVDRVQRAFLETPCLRVTLQQAQERWHMDELTARQILDAMVESHILSYSGRWANYSLDIGGDGLLRNLNLDRFRTDAVRIGRAS